jgi:hypothetical protein
VPEIHGRLFFQEFIRLNPCLFENGSQRAFRHVTGVIWDG